MMTLSRKHFEYSGNAVGDQTGGKGILFREKQRASECEKERDQQCASVIVEGT